MSDMLAYEAVQLKKLLADEKTIKDKYIKAAESVSVIEGLTGEANDR